MERRSLIAEQRAFAIPFAAFVVLGAWLMCAYSKADIHLAVDAHHSGIADAFFAWITWLGDGWSPTLLVILLLFVRYRLALAVALANISASLVVQVLKNLFFRDVVRPLEYFRGTHTLHLVQGVEVYSYHSFPSGHAGVAFASCWCLALMVRSNASKAALFVLALAIAFSRVYLSEHFFQDIYAGALIGFFCAWGISLLLERQRSRDGGKWMERSIRLPWMMPKTSHEEHEA